MLLSTDELVPQLYIIVVYG